MKVKDLILELQKHNQEAEVVVDGYGMGVSDVRKIVATVIFQNENRPTGTVGLKQLNHTFIQLKTLSLLMRFTCPA